MRPQLSKILCLGSLLLAGCAYPWAEPGQGGLAEHYPAALWPTGPEAGFTSLQALRLDLNHSQRHLDILLLDGARACFPAHTARAELLENRILRELAGGLYQDAANDLLRQRKSLHRLEEKLEAAGGAGTCVADSTEAEAAAGTPQKAAREDRSAESVEQTLLAMLNSDNQFALDSAAINPKYARRLGTACRRLAQRPGVRLEITGHSDAAGNAERKRDIARARADRVFDFLVGCGIDAARISLHNLADEKPLYDGRSPAIDLVNRRVSISLHSPERND